MLHRRTRAWSRDDPSVKAALHVLERPVSAALLISLMFTPWLYPRAGVAIRELGALLLMIPLLRVLPALVYRPMRAPLYVLAVPYFLSRLHALALPRSTLDRLLLLAVAAITFVGLVMLLRIGATKAKDSVGASGWWRTAVWVMRLGWVSLAVAIVADVIGAVALAEVLVAGTLTSTLVAGVLLAAVLVIRGVVAILLRTKRAHSLRSVSLYGTLIERRVARFLNLAALVLWLYVAFNVLNVFGPVAGAATNAVSARWTIGTVNLSLGDVLAFFASVYVALLVSRFVRFLLQEDVFPRLPLARGVPNTITMLINYAIVGIGFLLALSVAGFDLTRLTIIAGALSVGIGFGLQNVVNNFVSGLILAFERPVQIGDTIEVGRNTGEVRRIGIRSSTIRTAQGAEVIVPNGNLIANEVVNWTLSDRDQRLSLKVGVAYGNDPARIIELLRTTVLAHPKVRTDHAPVITFDGFGESSLDFTVRYWGTIDDSLSVGSEVATAIYQVLTAAGIDIPAPRRDVRVMTMTDPRPERRRLRPARLRPRQPRNRRRRRHPSPRARAPHPHPPPDAAASRARRRRVRRRAAERRVLSALHRRPRRAGCRERARVHQERARGELPAQRLRALPRRAEGHRRADRHVRTGEARRTRRRRPRIRVHAAVPVERLRDRIRRRRYEACT
jgi:small-conductance mechanosensitive channel